MIQDFLSHGISIPIGSSNKFTKKLVKMLHQNCNRCGLVNAIWLTIWHWLMCNGNFITGPYWNDIFRAFSSRDVDMICENWHTHLNCTLGAHCSSCKAAGRILHFCKPLQFMKRSIYVLVVEDQKSINDMHDYTLKSTYTL